MGKIVLAYRIWGQIFTVIVAIIPTNNSDNAYHEALHWMISDGFSLFRIVSYRIYKIDTI